MTTYRQLTEIEKYAILYMIDQEMSLDQIKKKLDRGPGSVVVEKYLDEITDKANVVEPQVFKKALQRLESVGIPQDRGRDLLKRVLRRVEDKTKLTTDQLFNAGVKSIGAAELIKNRTDGGKTGVSVMTPEAAAIKSSNKQTSNEIHRPSHIFRPKN